LDAPDFAVYIFSLDDSLTGVERLETAAATYTGKDHQHFAKQLLPNGKPYFHDFPDLHFSISHSGDYWISAFGPAAVGIDLQQHIDCNVGQLSRRFFHPQENDYLSSLNYSPTEFFNIWAAKESYVKYTGQGISGFDKFSVIPNLDVAILHELDFLQGYSLYLCAKLIGKVNICSIDLR